MKKDPYEAPAARKFELRAECIICLSDTPLGTTENEGYKEEYFIW